MSKKLKVGVHRGDGPPPGYKWNMLYPKFARAEAMKFLDEPQYGHIVEQYWELARQDDPTRSSTISLDAIEDYHELRDKGGVLRSLNVRVYFYVDRPKRSIVVIGADVKKNDGATLQTIKIRMRRRVRAYLRGEWGEVEVDMRRVNIERGEGGSGP